MNKIEYWSLLAASLLLPTYAMGQVDVPGIGATTTVTYDGFTEPDQDIMVAANELGRLESIDIQIGDTVDTGQIVGKLEDSLQRIAVRLGEQQVTMTGELNAATAEADLRRSRAVQLRQLVTDQMARPDELLRAETDLRIAVARHQAAQEQMEMRKLELDRFRLQLERRQIRAPIAGVIADIFHRPGEYITPADPAIMRLLVIDKLYAVFNVPVEDARAFRVGNMARVFVVSSSKSINAPITSIDPHIDAESGTVRVRVRLDNRDHGLLAGDQCTMQLLYGRTAESASEGAAPHDSRQAEHRSKSQPTATPTVTETKPVVPAPSQATAYGKQSTAARETNRSRKR